MAQLAPTIILNTGTFRVLEFNGTPGDYVEFSYRPVFTPSPSEGVGIIISGLWMSGPFQGIPDEYVIEPPGYSDHITMNLFNPPGKPPGKRSRRCLETGVYLCVKSSLTVPFQSRRMDLQAGNLVSTYANNVLVMPKGSFTVSGVTYTAPTVMTTSTSKTFTFTSDSTFIEFWP